MIDHEVDMSDYLLPEAELVLVDEFLTKFTIVTEQSISDHLDIMLILKALPKRIDQNNLEQIDNIDFLIL